MTTLRNFATMTIRDELDEEGNVIGVECDLTYSGGEVNFDSHAHVIMLHNVRSLLQTAHEAGESVEVIKGEGSHE